MEQPIKKLTRLYEELDVLNDEASATLLAVKDAGRNNEYELERDGKTITLKEPVLWTEVLHLGASCQAGEILSQKYPQVFDKYDQQSEKADELQVFIQEVFGFDYTKMRVIDIIKIVEFVLNERGVK